MKQNDNYYSPILSGDFYEYNVYDMLDFVNKHKSAIFNRIDLNMRRSYGRTTNKIFYDVTNFFFDTDYADKYENEDNETNNNIGRHFMIEFCIENREYEIKDLGVGYGTFVKIDRIHHLKDNQLINIGQIFIVVNICENVEKGNSFSTYASRCIENEILMFFCFSKKVFQCCVV